MRFIHAIVAAGLLLLLGGCSSLLCPPGKEVAPNPGTYGVWTCKEKK